VSVSRNPLARAREAAGFSQETFADAVGVSRNTVSRWEREMFLPTVGLRLKVSDALGTTPRELHDLLDHARRWSYAMTGADQPAVDEAAAPGDTKNGGKDDKPCDRFDLN